MPDRLAEIRARLDDWQSPWVVDDAATAQRAYSWAEQASADLAWLLDEVERLERENADDLMEITRKASDAEDYWMQEAKRLAAEVERLERVTQSERHDA